jgi:putative heme transporter
VNEPSPQHTDADRGESQGPRHRTLVYALLIAASVAGLYIGLPQIAGLDETWGRLSRGDPWWLAAAAAFEGGSYAGYVVLFRGIFVRPGSPLGWRESYLITMAGVAATRIFAAAGAGGIALTAWALSRSGMPRITLVRGLTTFYAALYSVYMLALVAVGLGLRGGLLPGRAPFGLTVVPALFGGCVITGALLTALLPQDLDGRVRRRAGDRERLGRWAGAAAGGAAAVAGGVRGALGMLRRGDPALLGAIAWWGFDIAVLWSCLRAFGEAPPVAVLTMAYFVGMLGNLLPLPGGVGGVEGGMIGALIAFGVPGGLAVVSVLSYRAFSFWLPTLPGALAYVQLRRTIKGWERSAPPASA